MSNVDVHQHLLSEPLIAELARRREPPALARGRDGWTFRVAGEPDSVLTFDATNVALRTEEARPLLEAHHQGIDALPADFGGWGAVALQVPDPEEVDAAIGRGCVGISLPATALATPDALERIGPLLARLEHHDAPL